MRGRNIWVQPDNTYDSENESISSGSLNMYGGNMTHNNLDTTSITIDIDDNGEIRINNLTWPIPPS